MPRSCSRRIVLLALLLNCGCAVLAKKTPTPAAQIDGRQLAQIPPPPGERYYLLLFGSQDRSRWPAYTHTWATLVRATDRPGCEPLLEAHSISWMPAKLDIDTFNFNVEPGRNLTLEESLRNALRTKQDVAMWGPYEVWHGFAYRFMVQKQFMDSGAVGYQCIDGVGEAGRTGDGCDCIHAISDMDPAYPRWRYPLAFYGQPATANLVRRIMHSPVTVEGWRTHDWLIPRLGLDQYPIERRRYHGRVVPWEPGAPGDLDAVRALPLPGAPVVPKEPPPPVAPGAVVPPGKLP